MRKRRFGAMLVVAALMTLPTALSAEAASASGYRWCKYNEALYLSSFTHSRMHHYHYYKSDSGTDHKTRGWGTRVNSSSPYQSSNWKVWTQSHESWRSKPIAQCLRAPE